MVPEQRAHDRLEGRPGGASDGRSGAGAPKPPPTTAFVLIAWSVLCAATLAASVILEALSYYVSITLMLIYTLVGYFVCFERGTGRGRELVTMAVMCACAVVSRAVFIWVPFFKPMAAIIMIAGIGMGSRGGFIVGVLAVFVSNLIFGQGPWTPWQMVAFGVAGLIMGLLPKAGIIPRFAIPKARLVLTAVLGALEVVLITGPTLDIYALVSMMGVYTPESLIAILLAGLPVNAIQAAATFITILLLGNPILRALHRATRPTGRPAH